MMMCAYMLNHTLNYLRFLVSDMYYDLLESYLINYKILPIAGSLYCHMINLPTLLFLGVRPCIQVGDYCPLDLIVCWLCLQYIHYQLFYEATIIFLEKQVSHFY